MERFYLKFVMKSFIRGNEVGLPKYFDKGFQRSKPGRKRPKYEVPQNEHPYTLQNLADYEIHANHVEAFNASLRRKNSTDRRRTNTYAKTS